MKLLSKIDEYNNEAKSETKIDNFEELEILYNQMQDYAKILEKIDITNIPVKIMKYAKETKIRMFI